MNAKGLNQQIEHCYDVVIVGGAAMGSAAAYFLASSPDFDGSVLVVERDPTYADCATERSWGGIRQQFTTPGNVRMSQFGLEFLRNAAHALAVEGEVPELAFRERGYLFLATEAGVEGLRRNVERQRGLGADIALLDPGRLADRFPWLSTDGLAGGSLGLSGEGWFDPHALLFALRRKARSLGVAYANDNAVAILRQGARVTGVRLARSGKIASGMLVNAAGPQAGRLAALAAIDLPVRPRKRMTYVFDCRENLSAAPMTIDPTGVCFRPEGGRYIAIVSPPADADPDSEDLVPEHETFDETIWPALAARVPAFEAIKLTDAWAGLYDLNTFDQNAIIGPHPEVEGILFCNGFSGHGVQQAPAAGRAIAELIVHGEYRALDLSDFGFGRIVANQPLRELNVV